MIKLREAAKKRSQKRSYTKSGNGTGRTNPKSTIKSNIKRDIKPNTKSSMNPNVKSNEPSHKRKEKYIYSNEIFGIAFAAVGILLLLSFVLTSSIGLFGAFIKKALTGIMGVTSYIIAPVIIIYSVVLIFRNIRRRTAALTYAFILMVLVAAMIHTGYYNPEEYRNLSLINTLSKFFNDGTQLRGGGVIGGLVSYPFILLFRQTGTLIILTTLSIITIILLTDVSMSDFFKSLWRGIKRLFIKIYSFEKDEYERKAEKTEDPDPREESGYGRLSHEPDVIDFETERKKKEFSKKHDLQISGILGNSPAEKIRKPSSSENPQHQPLQLFSLKPKIPLSQRRTSHSTDTPALTFWKAVTGAKQTQKRPETKSWKGQESLRIRSAASEYQPE